MNKVFIYLAFTLCSISAFSQDCPQSMPLKGYIIYVSARKSFSPVRNDTTSWELLFDINTPAYFIPFDSIRGKRGLVSQIQKVSQNHPTVYSLKSTAYLRFHFEKKCSGTYSSRSIDEIHRERSTKNYYQVRNADLKNWVYQIYYFEADWWHGRVSHHQFDTYPQPLGYEIPSSADSVDIFQIKDVSAFKPAINVKGKGLKKVVLPETR